jgi:hypothetical protein
MTKFTQKQLKELVKSGAAVDITNGDDATRESIESKEGYYTQIGYPIRVYAIMGKDKIVKYLKNWYSVKNK